MNCSTSGDAAAETHTPDSSSDLFPVEGTEGPGNDACWRSEVAARLERYRSRRKPRAPRYPTLRLPFDAGESHSFSTTTAKPHVALCPAAANEVEPETFSRAATQLPPASGPEFIEPPARAAWLEYDTSNVIEFPRSAVIPVFREDQLAEPILDRPRIVEAPEVIPPPPALGGILIEPAPSLADKRDIPDFARQPASLARRLAAGAIDALILTAALAGFAAMFQRINSGRLPIPLLAAGLLSAAGMLWLAYEFLFVVYTGSTPGWRIARLRLAKFDGTPALRSLRRWRVLASFLSAFSIGLGYLWSILDEDGLCWHDRITHTCLFLSDYGS